MSGVTAAEQKDLKAGAAGPIVASFDRDVPTHSATQTFHVDEARRLIRHDYTADVIGRWAAVANYCLASEQVAGLRFYTRRKVYPRMGRRLVMPLPRLVWIEIDNIEVVSK